MARAAFLAALVICHAALARAQAPDGASAPRRVALDRQPLETALPELARQLGVPIAADAALLRGRQAPAIEDSLSAEEALRRLLQGSDLQAVREGASYVVRRAPAVRLDDPAALPEVRVVAEPDLLPGGPPAAFAGGQVARGARIGVLGDRPLAETPISAKSFTEAYIVDTAAFTSNDILARDASFVISNAATLNGATAGKLRGFRIEPFESSYDGYATVSSRRYPLEMVERVEILKGPTTIFTGVVGGVGGTVNYVSKKPLDTPLTRLTGLYSSQGQVGTQLDLSRRFGPEDSFGLRANLAWRDGETAIDGLDETNRIAHLAFNWQGERHHLDLQFGSLYGLVTGSASGYLLTEGTPVPRVPDARKVGGPAWDRREHRDEFVRAALDVALTESWSVAAVLGLGSTYERFVGFTPTFGDPPAAGGSGFAQQGRSDWGDNHAIDVALRGRLRTGPVDHQLTLAYGTRRSKAEYSTLAIDEGYAPPVIDIYDPGSYEGPFPELSGDDYYPLSDTRNEGITLADELSLLDDRLRLTVGLRHTRFDVRSYNYAAPTPPGEGSRYQASDTSPSFGVLWKLTPDLALYANSLRAVEQGAIAPPEASNAGAVIPPGVARQTEAGLKLDRQRWGMTAAVFEIERLSTYIDRATGVFGEYGRNRHRGVEFDLFGEPWAGVRTQVSLSLLDAKVKRNQDPALVGKTPVSVPEEVAVISVDADLPPWPGAALQAGLRYQGRQYYDLTNERSVPSSTVLDLGARYRFTVAGRTLTARLAVGNVLSRDYWQSTDFTLQAGAPRTVRFSLQADL